MGMQPLSADVSIDQDMHSVLDRELSNFSEDAFGHRYFSNALRNLIEGPHLPPYSIGLLGSWGTGKSTIKQLYLASLEADSTGTIGKRRKNRFHPVTFNAWRYGGDEDIKRALLRHVFIALGGDEVELRRNLYQQISESGQSKRGLGEWLKEAMLQNAASTILFVILFAAIMGIIWLASYSLGLSNQWGLATVLITGASVAAYLAKNVVDIRLKSPTLFNSQTVVTFPATSAEEYERLLIKQVKKFRSGSVGRSCERLVVFVDDLDRLSATEMVSGLDAVRTFLELPLAEGSEDFGVVFIISCDEDRVADALSRGRGRVNPELPGSVFTRSDARRYLDRLFQFRLEIPPFPKLDMRQFIEKKLAAAGSIGAEIEKRGIRLQDLVERLIHVGVQSPRNAIQILNAFIQTWWIAVQRERSGVGSSAPGVLHEGAVTSHPLALAALCVLRVDFPDFYNELQKRPELIQEFIRVVFRREAPESLAISAQLVLKEFLVVENGKIGNDVRAEHRSLRQYLSSLLDLRWPKSLQPLLLLAQDAISRKFGDRAAELNDFFVSGDVQGVLETFGRHLDNDDLEPDDIRLLEELAEGLSDDTEIRRINAARVLAALVHRIPKEHRNGLMVPLARQMIDLKKVRTNVGPRAAMEVIASLETADRREVADHFASDLLTGQKLDWQLPTGETPNLEELVADVKAAADLILDVRRIDRLLASTEPRLKNWLLGREVQIATGAQTLPFSQLETWMEEHEEHLLPFLGPDYTRLAIFELGNDPVAIRNKDQMFRRIAEVWRQLAEEGQESRQVLWQQLTGLVAVQNSEGASNAWENAGSHAALASIQEAQAFLVAMANRLHKDMEHDDWALDWERGAQTLLDLATRWDSHIDSGTAASILPLVISWSELDETSAYMVRAAEILTRRDSSSWNRLLNHITAKAFAELPWMTLEYIASKLGELTDEHKTALASQLNAIVNADPIEEAVAEKYVKFVAAAPASEWSAGPLQGHTKVSRNRVLAMHARADYLSAIYPAARILLAQAPKGQAGPVLKQLFEQAAGAPDAYAVLHREMVGNWPREDDQTGQYEPTNIARRAFQFIKDNPAAVGSGDVLRSVVDMATRGLVTESLHADISNAATVLWRHSPSAVRACIDVIAPLMSPGDVQALLTGKQPSEPGTEALQAIVDAASVHADEQRCQAIALAILAVPAKAIGDQPDGALTLWLSSLRDKEQGVLKALLKDASLNEDQRERVLMFSMAARERLGLEFFVETAPLTLARAAEAKPLAAMIQGIEKILSLARNSDQRSSLASALVPTLPSLTKDSLVAVARAINRLGGKGILERNVGVVGKLDADQIAILLKEFPDSKVLSRYSQSSGTEAAE
ncbi:P-loop NTPase fold protein [Mesorhizobium sp.]|uniref:P-loop NTPase fold protein n=1 Tax=Mesorhizobium sp. TaxID=1871066 RepID=UPI000FE36971|nr:P-loop NTPase fold protein [Mesorhizobium sp.]RWK29820.1 MAG: NTPase KAP [Mesorhizobium sp.]TJV81321.1 MAG: NTPase KAP [Mesorhizobium sp.]TJW13454.1 MAG: NTPase KAP [Mesorhizobium sp.]